jgi:hypothetical protein
LYDEAKGKFPKSGKKIKKTLYLVHVSMNPEEKLLIPAMKLSTCGIASITPIPFVY